MAHHSGPPARGPKSRNRGRNALWLTLAIIAIALVAYFTLFTRTPEEGTRLDAPAAGSSAVTPEG